MSENHDKNDKNDKKGLPPEFDYEAVMSPDQIDETWREGGWSAEAEEQITKIIDAYVRAVRRAIYDEVDMNTEIPDDISQIATLAWVAGWRHGGEFARAMLAGHRKVLNPSRPISLRRLGVLVEEAYGTGSGAKNPTRLRKKMLDSGYIASHDYGPPGAKQIKKVFDLDDLYRVWPALRDHAELIP